MQMKWISLILILSFCVSNTIFAAEKTLFSYSEHNKGRAVFDISMPIDATGFTLHGKNLTGGDIQFTDQGQYVAPFLAEETGEFTLPIATSTQDKPLLKTTIHYRAIKLIDPVGIDNLFIKIGIASRTQVMSGLDPYVIKKDGSYTWEVPIFAVGRESDTVDDHSSQLQFLQVGSGHGPDHNNSMYTQEFFLYTHGHGDAPIAEHPQHTARLNAILKNTRTRSFDCTADGIWGGGGSDPYRTILGKCHGTATTFPAGPNVDYEYGTIILPTVETPWTATKKDHCFVKNVLHAGCTKASIGSTIHYAAQKIRVPIGHDIILFAESGSAYRTVFTHNLRYQNLNVYLKKLITPEDFGRKSYLSGGFMTPYFAVGFEFEKNGVHYKAQYSYTNESENSNRLAWRDASDTQVYAITVSGAKNKIPAQPIIHQNFIDALHEIQKTSSGMNDILVTHFLAPIFKTHHD